MLDTAVGLCPCTRRVLGTSVPCQGMALGVALGTCRALKAVGRGHLRGLRVILLPASGQDSGGGRGRRHP